MRGTPGAWHWSTVSVCTCRSLRSLTFARNSDLYLGKFVPRSPGPGKFLLAAPGSCGQSITQTDPSDSFWVLTKLMPAPCSHVPFRSGRPSGKCGVGFADACALTFETRAEAATKATITATTIKGNKR